MYIKKTVMTFLLVLMRLDKTKCVHKKYKVEHFQCKYNDKYRPNVNIGRCLMHYWLVKTC